MSIILSKDAEASGIVIRDIDEPSEMRAVEVLQKEVWGCDDLDVVPLTMLVASKVAGAVLIGAYDGASLAGFVYGFPSYEEGRVTHHSHMLAVSRAYRNHDLGYQLKLAQRERVLAQGIKQITWTFDPLQSLNAYFNFKKLGVIADSYKHNFYGEATSSFLHRSGTDRLWVTWLLESQRVRERLQSEKQDSSVEAEQVEPLVQVGLNEVPLRNDASGFLDQEQLSIEIPGNVNALQTKNPKLAVAWREATRWAFTQAMNHGYQVEEFYRVRREGQKIGSYLLSRKNAK